MIRWCVVAAGVGIVLACTKQVVGITISRDTVYDQSCPGGTVCGEGLVVVDGDDPPTVLEVVDPARLEPERAPAVALRDTSILKMSGGVISSAESMGAAVDARDQTAINVTGGIITGVFGISARGESHINVSGGEVSSSDVDDAGLWLSEKATGEMSGGPLEVLGVVDQGYFNIGGGSVFGPVIVDDSGVMNVSGG